MGVGGDGGEGRLKVEHARRIFIIIGNELAVARRSQSLQLRNKGRPIACPDAIMQAPGLTVLVESGDHRAEGRVANTSRDEYGNLGVLSKLEIVARLADLHNLTKSQLIHHSGRNATNSPIRHDRYAKT